ncbi:MAG: hypothetical protein J0M04_07670 [Verrucomicrobia bacterium]|nr:hypothetical protein [Verrucomicrobiota bacterium]
MNLHRSLIAAALVSVTASAETPKIFAGLLEEGVPMRGEVGIVLPPREIDRFVAKVEAAARQDPKWFKEFSAKAKPGVPLPFDPKLGLTQEEYDEYRALWAKREFKRKEEVLLQLRKSVGDTWIITATGQAGCISTLRYNSTTDSYNSPNGELKRIDDIKADADSILGAWSGKEWKFEEETSLGKSKENIALGKLEATGHGLIVYRFQEVSSEGTTVVDRSVVIRFTPGKAGQIKLPDAKVPDAKTPAKPAGKTTPKR